MDVAGRIWGHTKTLLVDLPDGLQEYCLEGNPFCAN